MAAPQRDHAGSLAGPGPGPHTLQPPALDALGADRAVEYLRCLLVRYGVLPPRDRRLADFQRWAAARLDGIGDAGHRQLLERFLRWRLLRHLRSSGTTAAPLGHGPYQRAKQRLTVAIAFLSWLASGPAADGTWVNAPSTISTRGSAPGPPPGGTSSPSCPGPASSASSASSRFRRSAPRGRRPAPPGPDARLAAIRRLLLDQTLAPGDRIAGCLVALYGQQVSTIAALRTPDTSCAAGVTRLKLGADWLDVPEPVATLLGQHLRNRTNMATAANPASPWLFPGQLAGEHRSYHRLVRVLHQLGIPARASRLAAWRELARQAPPAVLADALGVWPGTAMRHAFLGGAGWSAYAARRHPHTPGDETPQ